MPAPKFVVNNDREARAVLEKRAAWWRYAVYVITHQMSEEEAARHLNTDPKSVAWVVSAACVYLKIAPKT